MSSSPGQTYSSTFPAELPTDLDDSSAIALHDQEAFFGLDRLLRHWDRPHRTSIGWLLDFGAIPEAVELAERCQRSLPETGLDHIPGRWLHMTIRRLGYADEVSGQAIDAALTSAQTSLGSWEPLNLELVPLAGSPGAVRFSIAPWTRILDLFDALADASQDSDIKAHDKFRPHVGIAYSGQQQPASRIQDAVGGVAHGMATLPVTVRSVSLARVERDRGFYRWETVGSVEFGG